jgi:CMP-N-acetylneuraminic acid synthetase
VYQISWANEILTRECIERCGYMVGENPYWFDAYNPTVDIDTERDWELAQVIYTHYKEKHEE